MLHDDIVTAGHVIWIRLVPIQDDVIEVSVPLYKKHQVGPNNTYSQYIYRPETLYFTQNKQGILFTGTRIRIVPNSALFRAFRWFAYL